MDEENGRYTRVIETVSRSNSHWHSTFRFLHKAGAQIEPGYAPDIAALRNPMLYSVDQLADGIVDVQRMRDQAEGVNIRYGEIVGTNDEHVEYAALRDESLQRELQLEDYIGVLAQFEQQLDQQYEIGTISAHERQAQYGEMVRRCLRSICALAPEYARDCFGEAAAPYYYAASQYVARGDMDRATQLIYASQAVEESITFCGVTLTPERASELGLTMSDLKKLTEDAKENWKWKRGKCRIEGCPSPQPTKIGPCSICWHCQEKFDSPVMANPTTKVKKSA
jgi:hypothetical protein